VGAPINHVAHFRLRVPGGPGLPVFRYRVPSRGEAADEGAGEAMRVTAMNTDGQDPVHPAGTGVDFRDGTLAGTVSRPK